MASDKSLVAVNINEVVFKNPSDILLVALGAVIISFSPVFVRVASVGPSMAGFYRTLFGGIILAAIALARRKIPYPSTRQRGCGSSQRLTNQSYSPEKSGSSGVSSLTGQGRDRLHLLI